MSSSDAVTDSSESICSIVGAMLWQINSRNGLLLNLAAASIWLSHMMHSALLVPSKIFVFHHLFADVILFVVVGNLC